MSHGINSPALDYIRKLYAPEDDILRAQRDYLEAHHRAIQVGAEEGKILQLLIHLHQPKKIVEIGTLVGYSTLWMARALPKDGHIYTLEQEPANVEKATEFLHRAGVMEQVTIMEGSASSTLPLLQDHGPFDMIFIDADKISYPHYLDWAEQHLRTGALVVADNTLLFGSVYLDPLPEDQSEIEHDHPVREKTWKAMREFNQRLADPHHYDSIMLPTHEGLSVAIRKG